jgi:hypothetical protein
VENLPPELVAELPLAAVLLWIGIQARRELVSAIDKLGGGISDMRGELRELRRDFARTVSTWEDE